MQLFLLGLTVKSLSVVFVPGTPNERPEPLIKENKLSLDWKSSDPLRSKDTCTSPS